MKRKNIYIDKLHYLFILVIFTCVTVLSAKAEKPIWLQPSENNNYELLWGFKEGIQIRILPKQIRGLISVHAPYVGQQPEKVTNFIAVEPIPKGQEHRGLSELEWSKLDDKRGKRIWSSNSDAAFDPGNENIGATGIVKNENGIETLSVYFFYEPFDNGAKVYVKVKFYENNPYEFELSAFKRKDSAELDCCVLTATMGNYARLRNLYLQDGIKTSLKTWPDYQDIHFTPHDVISSDLMLTGKNGFPYFIASPDEKDPENAEYAEKTTNNWKYQGKPATQYWYCKDADTSLQGLVNGRYVYWAGDRPIPGGISYENFEMKKKFRQGDRFVFGISPLDSQIFISEKIKIE